MFLTLFLLCGGLFALAAAVFNWHWFYQHPKAALVTLLLGRVGARGFYGLLGLTLAGVGGWRLVSPPTEISPGALRTLTHPAGTSVLVKTAAVDLEAITLAGSLNVVAGEWTRFSTVITAQHSLHSILDDTDTFAVDFEPGFLMRHRFEGRTVRATIFYFDASLQPCDNFLFSSTPLSSAEFVVVVWDKAASEALGLAEGLKAVWYRRTDPDFAKHANVD
jgi:hypothetical protein